MSKVAPVFLSVLLLFSVLGYMTIYSISDEDSDEFFTCDSGDQIPLELQNDGFEDCPDSSDEDVIDHSKHLHPDQFWKVYWLSLKANNSSPVM